MRVPTRDGTKNQSGAFTITRRDVANPVEGFVANLLFTDTANSPVGVGSCDGRHSQIPFLVTTHPRRWPLTVREIRFKFLEMRLLIRLDRIHAQVLGSFSLQALFTLDLQEVFFAHPVVRDIRALFGAFQIRMLFKVFMPRGALLGDPVFVARFLRGFERSHLRFIAALEGGDLFHLPALKIREELSSLCGRDDFI